MNCLLFPTDTGLVNDKITSEQAVNEGNFKLQKVY